MLSAENEERLKNTVAETLAVDEDEITDDSSPQTLASWTSYNHLILMAAVEDAFGITLSMEEMTASTSYAQLRQTVAQYLS